MHSKLLFKKQSKKKEKQLTIYLEIKYDLGVNNSNVKYFDSFGVQRISKGNWKFNRYKNIIANIYRIQVRLWLDNVGIFLHKIYWFYIQKKILLDFQNLFSPNNFQQNDKAILNLFGVNYNSSRKYISTAPKKFTGN